MKRVLITGVSGHIGSFLAAELLERDDLEVWGTTRCPKKARDLSLQFPEAKGFLVVDYLKPDLVQVVLSKVRPTDIFHFAGVSTPFEVRDDREKAWRANVKPAENLMRASRQFEIKPRVFLASSILVFNRLEGDITEGSSTYGTDHEDKYIASKIAQEQVGIQYAKEGLGVFRLRFSQISDWGRHMDRAETDFGRQIILKEHGIIVPEAPLKVLGRLDGIIDVLSVKDAARALSTLLDNDELQNGEIVDVTSGECHRVGEIIEVMNEAAGIRNMWTPEFTRTKAPYCFSNQKLRELTRGRWKPKIGFDETIRGVLEYCRELWYSKPAFFEGYRQHFEREGLLFQREQPVLIAEREVVI